MKKKLVKAWPVMVSLGSAAVMFLAFLLPSIQDQWDRYRSREIIQEYVELGNRFFDESRFDFAEQAFTKAFELSGETRLDIEVKRLHARVNKINIDPEWGSEVPGDLEEIDFQYLLHMPEIESSRESHASVLNSYGVFLAAKGDTARAEAVFKQGLATDSTSANLCINYGNLLDQLQRTSEAEKYYKKAIRFAPQNSWAHYNLGLLYEATGRSQLAFEELQIAIRLDPNDLDAREAINQLLRQRELQY